jgi:nucleoid-associated protein YgaU/nucleoid DNA-binding protein
MVARVIDHPFGASVIPTPYNPDPALLAIVEIIRAGLIRDQHVRLHKFGTFRLRWGKERRVKHPKTGQSIIVPPAPRITFTPAKQLREWIEPNRKPVIPLEEPLSESPDESTRHETNPEQISMAGLTETLRSSQEHQQPNQPNLQETVQDIIDEQYNPTDNLTGFTNSQPSAQTDVQIETNPGEPDKTNKKWALGLLAAVPLIVFLLQSDFKNEPSGIEKSLPSETRIEAQAKPTPEPSLSTAVINNKIIRAENTKPDNQQSSTVNKPTTLVTARSEPTPKPFYMSPQVHTIQQGENLWSLAEKFYGDALLWPHIYRANTRTLSDPDKIITGKNLIIPGLQESPEFLTNKDRDLIAEGYFLVYEFNKANSSNQAMHFLIGAKQYSLEWLRENKSRINKKDWKTINKQ